MSMKAKKQAASEELKAHRARCEENFETEITQANAIDDPAEKVLRLEEIRRSMYPATWGEKDMIRAAVKKVYPWGNKQVAIGTALALPTLMYGGFKYISVREKHEKAFKAQLNNEAQGYLRYISERQESLAEMINTIMEEHMQEIVRSPFLKDIINRGGALLEKLVDAHVEEIAKSPLCKDIQDEPGLLRQFAEVALKKGISLPQEDAATAAIEQEMAAPRRKTDYSRLNALRQPKRTI